MPFLVVIGLQVLCIVHLMRTGRNPLWLTALIFLPVVSAIAYLIVEVLPGMGSNRHVRTARAKAIDTIDPERALRAARDALGLADTAANRLGVADALAALGRHAEAVPLYRESIAMTPGEPDIRSQNKLALSLFETGQAAEALMLLDASPAPAGQSERDRQTLLRARVLDHRGSKQEALDLYADLITRMPGEEARCRYAALLIEQGWERKALGVLEEVEGRMKRLSRHQRAMDAGMYRWATEALAGLRAKGVA
ncbi:tetratricopeptide repeat protein [Sphingomonas sp. DG1-23]|uniref:tetratricopeptide repeat protein n=1 Tax=Sphingomonas sp. DG1-23 TaxID=3068316 RepID=UPI00273D2592|nr:tetratricopeptide repeat protein [Sphingomonas sp. DG1-23]MDP5278455.1 tetratricopeptide repeat protein [Sphingomonas sp. DG1-23]